MSQSDLMAALIARAGGQSTVGALPPGFGVGINLQAPPGLRPAFMSNPQVQQGQQPGPADMYAPPQAPTTPQPPAAPRRENTGTFNIDGLLESLSRSQAVLGPTGMGGFTNSLNTLFRPMQQLSQTGTSFLNLLRGKTA